MTSRINQILPFGRKNFTFFFSGEKLLRFPRPSHHDFDLRLVLGDHVCGQDAAPVHAGINHRAASDDAAGIEHRVAADVAAVAEQRAELAQAGVAWHAVHLHEDISLERFHVGQNRAGAHVRLVTENGIADVIEMRHLAAVEEQRVLELARIADHAAIADDDAFAEIGVVADLAVAPNDGRAFDHHAVFEHRAFADEHILADVGAAFAAIVQARFQIGGKVGGNFRQSLPRELAAVEDRGVFGL